MEKGGDSFSFSRGLLKPFVQLLSEFPLKHKWFYQFLRLHHVLHARFSSSPVWFPPVQKWERGIGPFPDHAWDKIIWALSLVSFTFTQIKPILYIA